MIRGRSVPGAPFLLFGNSRLFEPLAVTLDKAVLFDRLGIMPSGPVNWEDLVAAPFRMPTGEDTNTTSNCVIK